MNLTPELKFIQEKLVLAAHPGLSLEEAKLADLGLFGCMSLNSRGELILSRKRCSPDIDGMYSVVIGPGYSDGVYVDGIIGLTPSLSRVLNRLGDLYETKYLTEIDGFLCIKILSGTFWKLLNDDGSDALLWDQDQNTITAIAREMGYKSE